MHVRVMIEREPGDSADDVIALFRALVRLIAVATNTVTITLTDRSA